ncbi:TPA: hypothetical protein QB352_001372 [Pasteurella multocida]|nr:hypothetical protein [Pasteurella multocida]
MSCWVLLGIEPTYDEREIRRAYAKKLKITRPDDDPEAYQRLREAFDDALMMAPYLASQNDYQDIDNWLDDDIDTRENEKNAGSELVEEQNTAQLFANEFRFDEVYSAWFNKSDFLSNTNKTDAGSTPASTTEQNNPAEAFSINTGIGTSELFFEHISASQLIDAIERWFKHGGDILLIEKWKEIQHLLTKLPIEESEDVSWAFLSFLRENNVENPMLWAQWSSYFNWHNDYQIQYRLNYDDIEDLNKYILLADLHSPQPTRFFEYPIFSTLLARVNQKTGLIFNVLCAFLIAPFLFYELPEPQRQFFEKQHKGIKRLYDWAILLRLMFRGELIIGLVIMIYYAETAFVDELISASVFILGFFFVSTLILMAFYRVLLPFATWLNRYFAFFFGLFVPIALILIRHFVAIPDYFDALYFLLLILSWVSLATRPLRVSLFAYIFMTCFVYFMFIWLTNYALELTIFWINFNFFLEKYAKSYFVHLLAMKDISSGELMQQNMLWRLTYGARALLIWFFLLPVQIVNWLMNYEDKGSVFELIAVSVLLTWAVSYFTSESLLFFYPIVFIVIGIQSLIKVVVMYQLRKNIS